MADLSSLWPYLLGGAGSLSALYGAWAAHNRQPADIRLITAQAESYEAEKGFKAVEASNKAVESLTRALDRLEHERGLWQIRERMLETQIETGRAQHVLDRAEVGRLGEELGHLAFELAKELGRGHKRRTGRSGEHGGAA